MSKWSSNTGYYYVDDALGSTRIVYKGNQLLVFSVKTYKPFGIAYQPTGGEKFTYAGEMQDQTGLFYLFARYYDPNVGRFISMDPLLGSLSSPQALNRYVYCANNPMRLRDPTGLDNGIDLDSKRGPGQIGTDPVRTHRRGFAVTDAYYNGAPEATSEIVGMISQGDYSWAEGVEEGSRPSSLDMFMRFIQVFPILGAVGCGYFAVKCAQQGDWGGMLLNIVGGALTIAPFIPLGSVTGEASTVGDLALNYIGTSAQSIVTKLRKVCTGIGNTMLRGLRQADESGQSIFNSLYQVGSSARNFVAKAYNWDPELWQTLADSGIADYLIDQTIQWLHSHLPDFEPLGHPLRG